MKNVMFRFFISLIQMCSLQAIEFEVITFDATDKDMQEQLCSMVADDKRIQRNTFLDDDKDYLREYVFNEKNDGGTYLLVSRIKNLHPPIYCGFLKYSIARRCRGNSDGTYTYGDLETLAVDGAYRKKGLAVQLIKRFEDECQDRFSLQKWDEKDFEPILNITVFSDNHEAIALYKKLGYEVYQSSPGYMHAKKSLIRK